MLARTLLGDTMRIKPVAALPQFGPLEGKPADQARESRTRILLNAAWQHGRGKPKLAVAVRLRARISRAVVREEDVRQGSPFSAGLLAIRLNREHAPCPS